MPETSSSSTAPDPPPDHNSSSSQSGMSSRDHQSQSSMDPTEYPIPSSQASVISLAPTVQEDHEALLIKLPPPKSADSNSSINLSKFRRRESVDPPEVLLPIDEFQESASSVGGTLPPPATIVPGDETIEQLSAALALVPYDDGIEDSRLGETTLDTRESYADSPCPPPTVASSDDSRRRLRRDRRGSSSRELVAYELNNQLVPAKSPSYPMRRGFDHCFISVPVKERLSALFATLRRNAERKVIVVFATWESAQFHSLLFRQLELFTVYEFHEHTEETDAVDAYDRFACAYPGVLMASDAALREFDVPPNVDYVLQYERTEDPTEYIYRCSSASLFETSCHKALLFLCPEGKEMNKFVRYFETAGVELSELQARKVSQFQPRVEKMIQKHAELNEAAFRAYRATVAAYESHPHKDVWDNTELDEESVLKSFAMPDFPVYVSSSSKERSKRREKKEEGNPHASWKKEKENPHASWRKEKTWKSGERKSWMEKQKSWKHAHSAKGLNDAAARLG